MIKSFSSFILLLALSFFARPASASELTDLGEGLAYLRVQAIDDSAKGLTAALRERDSLILDLRYTSASPESIATFQTTLAGRRTPSAPLFVLVSPSTPSALAEVLKTSGSKIIFLGIKDSLPAPHVIVDQPAATDRLAYEALGPDHSLASLITGKIDKPRYDEAALMKEFADGSPEPAPTTDSSAKPTDPATVKLSDRVLQRAVHLHRALLAIKQH